MFKKKKGQYSKKDKKRTTDRKVISYEDMPLEDYEQEKTDLSPQAVKKIIIGVAVAVGAGLLVFAFANRDKLSWDNISAWWNYDVLGNAGKGYPVNIVGTNVEAKNFDVNQGRVAYASDTSFITLNSSGSEVANVQLRYSKPVLKSCENRFLAYGLGESTYQIQSYDKNLYTGEAESIVYTGDIASNGVYCLVTEGNGFFSQLCVYDNKNNRVFKYSFSEYYITSVSLNRDGTRCVACGVTSDNGAICTGVYVLDFKKEEPLTKFTISNDTVLDCKYVGANKSALVGENASYIVTDGEQDYKTIGYDDKLIVNYCFSMQTNSFALALSKSGDRKSCELKVYSENGDERRTINNPYGAESLSIFKGTVAVLDGNMIYSYNSSGELRFSGDAGTGAKSIIMTSDNKACVLSINQIRMIELQRDSTADQP